MLRNVILKPFIVLSIFLVLYLIVIYYLNNRTMVSNKDTHEETINNFHLSELKKNFDYLT